MATKRKEPESQRISWFLYSFELPLLCMVEQFGKNLLNNIAHGLSDIKAFRKNNCLMVVYLFWLITAIKWVFPSESVDE